jgi:hypothetical protein
MADTPFISRGFHSHRAATPAGISFISTIPLIHSPQRAARLTKVWCRVYLPVCSIGFGLMIPCRAAFAQGRTGSRPVAVASTQRQRGDTLWVTLANGVSREIYHNDTLSLAWLEHESVVRSQVWTFSGDSATLVGGARTSPELRNMIAARRKFWIEKARTDSMLARMRPPG